jgi:hypothetical protein
MKIHYTILTFCLLLLVGSSLANQQATIRENSKSNPKHVTTIYPNPVQTKGVITVSLDQGSEVTIEFFDLTGKMVKKMSKEYINKGEHQIEFSSTEMKSGVYLCKISTSGWAVAKRIIINH